MEPCHCRLLLQRRCCCCCYRRVLIVSSVQNFTAPIVYGVEPKPARRRSHGTQRKGETRIRCPRLCKLGRPETHTGVASVTIHTVPPSCQTSRGNQRLSTTKLRHCVIWSTATAAVTMTFRRMTVSSSIHCGLLLAKQFWQSTLWNLRLALAHNSLYIRLLMIRPFSLEVYSLYYRSTVDNDPVL